MEQRKRTEISELGEFGFIDRITSGINIKNASTVKGIGDDAAVIECGDNLKVISTDMMLEGVNFDLTYFPLKHLGYKAVVAAISDVLAMNATAKQILVSIGLSARFAVEDVEELYAGIKGACDKYNIDFVGGDTSASMNGMVISITAIGETSKDKITYRSGAKVNDLICVTSNLGAAYMGLHLLEREKRVLKDVDNMKPQFEGREYILSKQLMPHARVDIIEALQNESLVPTSMIDISDGLSSDLMQICKSSNVGARIYLDRLPIAKETSDMAEELNSDPVVAALNGGEDYELLFTVSLNDRDKIIKLPGVDIIGHITEKSKGIAMTTPDGQTIELKAQGFHN